MENKITNQKLGLSNDKLFLSVLLSLILIQFAVLFFNHEIYVDTAWLGEYTYWLSKEGFVKSELMRGLMDFDEKIVFNPHKYFLAQGSIMIDLFGFSHYTLEVLVVIYLLVFSAIIWATRSYHLETKKNALIFFCLFLAYPLVQRFSIAYRPEIVIMCMGFVSYHFLNRFLNSHRILFLVWASIFAGIAALIHWNGLAFIGAGALLLLAKRKIIPLLIFSIIATLVVSVYVVQLMLENELDIFLRQFSTWVEMGRMGRSNTEMIWRRVFSIIKRMTHSPVEIVLTLLTLFSFVYLKIKNQVTKIKEPLLYGIFCLLSLSILTIEITTKYNLLFIPYLIIAITFGISHLIQERKNAGFAVIILFMAFSFYYNFQFSSFENIERRNEMLSEKIADKSSYVLAPMDFVFNEIKDYDHIQGLMFYILFKNNIAEGELNSEDYFREIHKNRIEYIILNEGHQYIVDNKFNSLEEGQRWYQYEIIDTQNDYAIFKSVEESK